MAARITHNRAANIFMKKRQTKNGLHKDGDEEKIMQMNIHYHISMTKKAIIIKQPTTNNNQAPGTCISIYAFSSYK